MIRLVGAELLKLRTTRTALALFGASVALAILVTLLTTLLTDHLSRDDVVTLLANQVELLFVASLAVVATTGEDRHRTLAGTILVTPIRWRVVVAKALAFFLAGMVLAAATTLIDAAIALPLLSARDADIPSAGRLLSLLAENAAAAGLIAAFGVGVGAIIRNQAAALISVLVLAFVVEPALALAPRVSHFAPFTTASALSGFYTDGELPAGWAGLVLLGWAVLLVGVGALVLARRDV